MPRENAKDLEPIDYIKQTDRNICNKSPRKEIKESLNYSPNAKF